MFWAVLSKPLSIDRIASMRKFLLALTALFLGMSPALSQGVTSTFPMTVPGSGTNMNFNCATTLNTPPCWFLMQPWDGTTKMTILPPGTTTEAGSFPTTSPTTTRPLDACYYQTRTPVPISTTAATTQLVAASASNRVYVCAGLIKNSAAVNIGIIEGGGATCAGGSGGGPTTALAGAITPAIGTAGIPLGAIGDGFIIGTGGMSGIRMITPNDSLCLVQSGTVLLGGWISVVITPF
jgi:hypothetical protein